MANITGIGAAAGGLTRGIVQGLNIRNQRAEIKDRERRTDIEEKSENRRAREEERLLRAQKRRELVTQLRVITDSFNNRNTPDSVKLSAWNGPYKAIMKELAPNLDIPTLTQWGSKSLGKFSMRISNIVDDSKLTSKQKLTNINAAMQEIDEDPEFLAIAEKGKEDIMAQRKEREDLQFRSDVEFFRRNIAAEKTGGDTMQVGDPDQDAMQLARIRSKGTEYANRIKDTLMAEQGDFNRKKELSEAGRRPEEPASDESFAGVLQSTGQHLKELKEQGKMNQLVFDQEISSIMQLFGVPEERRGEVEDIVNGIISEDIPIDIPPEAQEENIETEDAVKSWLDVLQMTPLIGGKNVFP